MFPIFILALFLLASCITFGDGVKRQIEARHASN